MVGNFLVWQHHGVFREPNSGFWLELKFFPANEQFAETQDAVNEAGADDDSQDALPQRRPRRLFSVQGGQREGAKEAHDHAADGDFVGNDEMFKINEGGDDQAREKDAIDQNQPDRLLAEHQPASQKHHAGQEFDEKIANGNGRAAVGAFAAKIKPGDERQVEVPGNGVIAMRAVRRRKDDAFSARQAMNADIEKAADHAAKKEENQGPEMKRHQGPIVRVEDGVNSHRYFFARLRA